MADIKADFCVVGAGPAGSIVASRLAAAGRNCVLVEEGPRYDMEYRAEAVKKARRRGGGWFEAFNTDRDLPPLKNITRPTTAGEKIHYGHEQGVGGTTLHWMANSPRPNEDDFAIKTKFGYGRDWPISYEELEPWLLQAEHEIGVAGGGDNPYASARSGPFPMPAHSYSEFERTIVAPAFEKAGWKAHTRAVAINSVPRQNRVPCQECRICMGCPSGAKYSADQVQIPAFENAGGTIVRRRLMRLETASDGKKIVAAHVIDQDETPQVVKANVFVLALGGIETTRILLLSKDEGTHKNGLGNLEGALGKNFTALYMHMMQGTLSKPAGKHRGFASVACEYFRRPGVDRSEHAPFFPIVLSLPGVFSTNSAQPYVEMATKNKTISLSKVRQYAGSGFQIWTMHELQGTGHIDLDPEEVDVYGQPRARITYQRNDWERASGEFVAKTYMPKMAEALEAIQTDDIYTTFDGAHPSGTSAMASSPKSGACDRNLRVFGLDNLYAVSSSVIPHLGPFNTTLTTCALAARLADHLIAGGKP